MRNKKFASMLLAAGMILQTISGTVPAYAAKNNTNLLKDKTKVVTHWEDNVTDYVPNGVNVVPVVKYTVTIPAKEYNNKIDSLEDIFSDGPVIMAKYNSSWIRFTATEIKDLPDGKILLTGEKTDADVNATVNEPARTVVEYVMMVDAEDAGTLDEGDIIQDNDGNGYIISSVNEIDDESDPNFGNIRYDLDPAENTVTYKVKSYKLTKKTVYTKVKKKGKTKKVKSAEYRVTLPRNKYSKTIKKGQKLYVQVKDNSKGELAIIKVGSIKKTKGNKYLVKGKLIKIS